MERLWILSATCTPTFISNSSSCSMRLHQQQCSSRGTTHCFLWWCREEGGAAAHLKRPTHRCPCTPSPLTDLHGLELQARGAGACV